MVSTGMNGAQLAEHWKAWLASPDGRANSDVNTLRAPIDQQQYLENRLWHAYMAGVEAAEIICGRK